MQNIYIIQEKPQLYSIVRGGDYMADNTENTKRIAELQRKEAEGQLSDEEAAELQKLQNETSSEGESNGAK